MLGADRRWDAVLDTCGYYPRLVRDSARLLQDRAGCYAFVSSISVYAEIERRRRARKARSARVEDETTEDLGPEHERYGPLKALCEQEVESVFGDRALVVRPGLIVGPHDPTGRFTYWPHRLARGGEILAPGPPERRVQFIDVRDLAEWILRMLEAGRHGVFNATGAGRGLGRPARRRRRDLGERRLPRRAGRGRVDGATALDRRSGVGRACTAPTSRVRSRRACASGRSRTRSLPPSSMRRRSTGSGSRPQREARAPRRWCAPARHGRAGGASSPDSAIAARARASSSSPGRPLTPTAPTRVAPSSAATPPRKNENCGSKLWSSVAEPATLPASARVDSASLRAAV